MIKLYSKHFRTLAGTTFKLDKIYPSYRQGFNKATNKMDMFVQKDGDWFKKEWDGEKFALVEGKPDFKLHKKVYDLGIIISKPMDFQFKEEVKNSAEVSVTLSAYQLGEMMKATVAFGKDIPQNNGRDAFDWEEEYLESVQGTNIIFSVTGEGIGTKYTFKEAKPFDEVKEEKSEDIKEVEEILGPKESEKEDLDELF